MTDKSPTTRPCSGCQRPVQWNGGVLLHDRRVGDVPFCCQECCDKNGPMVWDKINKNDAAEYSVSLTDIVSAAISAHKRTSAALAEPGATQAAAEAIRSLVERYVAEP